MVCFRFCILVKLVRPNGTGHCLQWWPGAPWTLEQIVFSPFPTFLSARHLLGLDPGLNIVKVRRRGSPFILSFVLKRSSIFCAAALHELSYSAFVELAIFAGPMGLSKALLLTDQKKQRISALRAVAEAIGRPGCGKGMIRRLLCAPHHRVQLDMQPPPSSCYHQEAVCLGQVVHDTRKAAHWHFLRKPLPRLTHPRILHPLTACQTDRRLHLSPFPSHARLWFAFVFAFL